MTSPVSPSLPVLRQLLNEASPLPWRVPEFWPNSIQSREMPPPMEHDTWEHLGALSRWPDAALVAAAVTALPALLDRLERQAAAIEAVQAVADELESEAQTREEIADHHPTVGAWEVDRQALRNGARRQRGSAKRIRTALSGITPTTEEKQA